MDCGCGSLFKLCGLKQIKFYDPHTSVDRAMTLAWECNHSLRSVLPATREAAAAAVVSLNNKEGSGVGKVQIKQVGQHQPL